MLRWEGGGGSTDNFETYKYFSALCLVISILFIRTSWISDLHYVCGFKMHMNRSGLRFGAHMSHKCSLDADFLKFSCT